MLKSFAVAALSLAAIASTSPAFAQTALGRGESLAMLSSPLKSGFDPVVAGRIWHCDGDACRASAMATVSGKSLVRECGDVAAKAGEIVSFQTGDTSVSADDLKKCNANAKKR
ncbi:hypothetical protein BH09PSE2_BH09PSE2_15190 [soil metagenome]